MNEPKKIRLVLADDHAVVRAGIRQFLDMETDLEVVAEADDGEQATRLIEQYLPDVAVLDIQMPKISGIEVTRHIRANHWPVGVLVLTAYEDEPYVRAVLKAGANGYILKTARPPDIIEAVRDVYHGKLVIDQAALSRLAGSDFSREPDLVTSPLSDREMEVLRLAARGFTNKAIAMQLTISDRTVQGHIARIFEKMQAASRTEAVMRAVSMGLISSDISREN